MTQELVQWATVERDFLREEIRWLKAGGKLLSPSGEDITTMKLSQLEARLEHARLALAAKSGVSVSVI